MILLLQQKLATTLPPDIVRKLKTKGRHSPHLNNSLHWVYSVVRNDEIFLGMVCGRKGDWQSFLAVKSLDGGTHTRICCGTGAFIGAEQSGPVQANKLGTQP